MPVLLPTLAFALARRPKQTNNCLTEKWRLLTNRGIVRIISDILQDPTINTVSILGHNVL